MLSGAAGESGRRLLEAGRTATLECSSGVGRCKIPPEESSSLDLDFREHRSREESLYGGSGIRGGARGVNKSEAA